MRDLLYYEWVFQSMRSYYLTIYEKWNLWDLNQVNAILIYNFVIIKIYENLFHI